VLAITCIVFGRTSVKLVQQPVEMEVSEGVAD
jgi:hypothetical protein